ncbi:v-type proton atpase subunit g [Anaeramoeba ignava]|uniref:V-type proton ATPase subunit G n=1 Tax=Anaeramoeba ignava TaxID=1746090 RepID=A0A9Q0LMJ2_ANAIG|nr:v-type proton atpase subunit g [Anaeramoeba ignava]
MQSTDPNIKRLLQAEQIAAQYIEEAEQIKTEKIKSARTKALEEISEIRENEVRKFEKFKKEHLGSTSQIEEKSQKETEEAIKKILSYADKNRDTVIDLLLKKVEDVDISYQDPNNEEKKK